MVSATAVRRSGPAAVQSGQRLRRRLHRSGPRLPRTAVPDRRGLPLHDVATVAEAGIDACRWRLASGGWSPRMTAGRTPGSTPKGCSCTAAEVRCTTARSPRIAVRSGRHPAAGPRCGTVLTVGSRRGSRRGRAGNRRGEGHRRAGRAGQQRVSRELSPQPSRQGLGADRHPSAALVGPRWSSVC